MNVGLSSSVGLAQQHLGRAISKVQRLGVGSIVTGSRNLPVATTAGAAAGAATSSTTRSRVSLALGIMTSFTGSAATLCAPDKKDDSSSSSGSVMDKLTKAISGNTESLNASLDELASLLGNQLQGALDSGIPTQLSYGFVSGYCSGLALKKVGRAAAVVFGMGFVALQTLQYSGYIQVDHGKLRKDVESMFDLDKDGQLDQDDAQVAYSKILSVLQYNMPAGGGFGAGFLGGLRSG